jgi:hypothetical protein
VCAGAWHEISTGVLPPGDKRPPSALAKWRRWSWDIRKNPFFKDSEQYLQEVLEENGWTEEDLTFQREYLGQWVVDVTAQVYRYVASRNAVTEVPLYDRDSWIHTVGVDFGMVDECAWCVMASHPHHKDIYAIRSIAKRGLLPEQAAETTYKLVQEFQPHRLVGDAGGLGKPYVEAYNERFNTGIRMDSAEKTEKRAYIELMNGDLATGRLKLLMPECADYGSEMESLPWSGPDREKEHAGYKNHRSDAGLYTWRHHTAYLNEVPKVERDPVPGEAGYEEWLEQREIEEMRAQQSGASWMSR